MQVDFYLRLFAVPIIAILLMTALIKTDHFAPSSMPAIATSAVSQGKNNRAKFEQLLRDWRSADATQRPHIETEIHQAFAQPVAVMILDMSGFSRTTTAQGIVPTLARIQAMNEATQPIVEHHGKLVKFEADNVFAVFPDARSAVQAAIAIFQRLRQDNIQVGIGIGYGDTLLIEEGNYYANDLYGEQVNLAAKLGEDLAEPDELLLTEAAFQQISPPFGNWKKIDLAVSGLQLQAYRLEQ
jgi:adenylate cyclase